MTIQTDPNFADKIVPVSLYKEEYTATIQVPEDLNQFILILNTSPGEYMMISQDLDNGYQIK